MQSYRQTDLSDLGGICTQTKFMGSLDSCSSSEEGLKREFVSNGSLEGDHVVSGRTLSLNAERGSQDSLVRNFFEVHQAIAQRYFKGTVPVEICNAINSYLFGVEELGAL